MVPAAGIVPSEAERKVREATAAPTLDSATGRDTGRDYPARRRWLHQQRHRAERRRHAQDGAPGADDLPRSASMASTTSPDAVRRAKSGTTGPRRS